MADLQQDQQFVEDVVRAIVNHPEDVRTERTIDEKGVLISVHINPADMGYVIGRSGQTARSIRTLLRIVGAKNNARVTMKIIEPEGSTHYQDRAARAERPEPSADQDSFGGSHADLDQATVDDLTI